MATLPKDIDFEIYRGDDSFETLVITNPDSSSVDLTSSQVTMLIQANKEEYLLKEGRGLQIEAPNKIHIHFSHDLTKDWTFRSAKYDLQVVDAQSLYKTFVRGTISIERDITP